MRTVSVWSSFCFSTFMHAVSGCPYACCFSEFTILFRSVYACFFRVSICVLFQCGHHSVSGCFCMLFQGVRACCCSVSIFCFGVLANFSLGCSCALSREAVRPCRECVADRRPQYNAGLVYCFRFAFHKAVIAFHRLLNRITFQSPQSGAG